MKMFAREHLVRVAAKLIVLTVIWLVLLELMEVI